MPRHRPSPVSQSAWGRLPRACRPGVIAGIALCAIQMVSSQEGGLAGLAGLGDLTRSFFAHDAYVGAHRFSLFHIRTLARVVVTGFSVDAVDGEDASLVPDRTAGSASLGRPLGHHGAREWNASSVAIWHPATW